MTGRYDGLFDWPTDIPFERVVRARLDVFDDLVGQGVTWPSITAALARAGVTRKDGNPLSWRQVHAVYRRSKNTAVSVQTLTTVSLEPVPPSLQVAVRAPAPLPPSGGLADRLREARNFNKIQSTEYEE